MSVYGAWELKTSYQRNLSFGLISSLFLSLNLFLITYFIDRIQILPTDLKDHSVKVKLFQAVLGSLNSFPAEPTGAPILSVQPPRGNRLVMDSLIQTDDFEWPAPRPFANKEAVGGRLVEIFGNETGFSDTSDDTIIDLDEFDLRPVILFKVDPKCPELARRGRITGTVTAEVLVGRDGLVREVSIKKSTTIIFDDEVTGALKLWVFRPWVDRNRCLLFRFTVMVEFVLR